MIRDHIYTVTFNNQDLSDFGVHTSGNESFNTPERHIEEVEVPGKNGSLTFDLGRYKNIDIYYPAFIGDHLEDNLNGLTSFLYSQKGYKKLVDSYHPDYYRMGMFVGPLDQEIILLTAGVFTLTFKCKPQKFLVEGDNILSFTSNSSIFNETNFNSKPLIKVYGNGTVTIGTYSFTVTNNANNNLTIDCETMDCYRDLVNCNSYVTFANYEIPELVTGQNTITLGTGISKIEITPRWWTI